MGEDSFNLKKAWQNFRHMPFRHKAFWFVAIFLAILTIRDTWNLVNEYLDDPMKADMNMILNETMTLPNITFCVPTKQVLSHFPNGNDTETVKKQLAKFKSTEQLLKKKWPPELALHAFQSLAAMFTIEREFLGSHMAQRLHRFINPPKGKEYLTQKRDGISFWVKQMAERNLTFEDFTQKAGKEVLAKSIKQMTRIVKDDDGPRIKLYPKITWVSRSDVCFQPTYDEENLKPITDQGSFFFLQVAQNKENVNTEESQRCISVDFHGYPFDWSKVTEGGGISRDGYHENLCPGLRHDVTVEVKNKYDMLENDEPRTACRDFSDDDDDEFSCRSRCRMELIRQLCQCTSITTQYLVEDEKELENYPLCNYSKCVIDVQKQSNKSEEACTKRCFRDCHQLRYSVSVDQKVSVTEVGDQRVRNTNLTSIFLLWGSFEYIEVTQSRVYTTASFIGELGGVIGMWLGLSMLSLIQMMTWATERIFVKASDVAKDVKHDFDRRHSSATDMNDGNGLRKRTT
ncbi:unnamed protein product [Bursaphelenchus okinawaensis]|uniref:Uncharacterized protein n=1 Tax=Bursaphelenchus okinawaensis TaxID=465554 RepID=A0A811L2E7_9BILA|nr:unnamed protein product [Bursaphelenchus okinawaensis]CAG9114985.1 unnamed protein product [Bursaphelenchus okinawaensis]